MRKPTISWNIMKKFVHGKNIKEKEMQLKHICSNEQIHTITLPSLWNFDQTVKACSQLGDGSVFSFPMPDNLTNFDFEYTFGDTFKTKDYFWTPYSDEEEEGVIRNVYNGLKINLAWQDNQPNGGTSENFIVLNTQSRAFLDVTNSGDDKQGFYLSCSVPHKIITFRGGCLETFLGREFSKAFFHSIYSS